MKRNKLNNSNIEKRQQINLFLKEIISFAVLFVILGLIIYFLFRQSIYRQIDNGIAQQKKRILNNKKPLIFHKKPNQNYVKKSLPNEAAQFHTEYIVFNRKGQVLNSKKLESHGVSFLKKVKLYKKQLNKTSTLVLYPQNKNEGNTYLRSLLIKAPKNNNNINYRKHYILILENIDPELISLHTFRKDIFITLIFFWILAILVAYILSRSSMKPIINSWERQREFSSNAAHELRTPLTIIQNQLEYLFTKPYEKIIDQSGKISTSLKEINHMNNLTHQLLTLARSDSNMVQIKMQRIPLESWFNKILKPYKEIIKSQKKLFYTSVTTKGSGYFDPDLIQQLITILMDNAIKYTPKNGTITVSIKNNRRILNFKITDTGKGIPNKDKNKIFERFYQVDHSHNTKTGGNGLGLSIAHWIVNQHQGKIIVKDNQPRGSIFSVYIKINK